ncbi:MAG: hypothetical protein RL169_562 [Armatimonadota bacterium]
MAQSYRKSNIRGIKRIVASIFLIGIVLAICVSWAAMTPMTSSNGVWVQIRVKPGDTRHKLAATLQSKGLIRSSFLFERLVARRGSYQPGTYRFRSSERPLRIHERLVRGDFERIRVTIPEGFTLALIAKRLVRLGVIQNEDDFLIPAEENASDFVNGLPKGATLEGYLYPDTYSIPVGFDVNAIIELMHSRQTKVMKDLDSSLDGTKRHRLLTIASMIEREAVTDRDRPLVASVIENRLRKGMRLEIDATVQYALGKHVNRVMFSHLRIDSPYNTYRKRGLPPGPIANPGRKAIIAAAKPASTPYYFYVLGQDRRNHVFTTTYKEHLIAIRKYRPKP